MKGNILFKQLEKPKNGKRYYKHAMNYFLKKLNYLKKYKKRYPTDHNKIK